MVDRGTARKFPIRHSLLAELVTFSRKHLSPIKCPRSVDFEAELPRTPTGKLVKRHLRDRYWPKAAAKA
jgi:long-chain acyl-CoA synthetase